MSRSLRKFSLDLFLVALFPSHLWAIYRSLIRGGGFVYEQYGAVDLMGFISYNLQYALIESILVSMLLIVLSLVLLGKWRYERRLSIMVAAYLCVVGPVVLRWGFFALGEETRFTFIGFLNRLPGAVTLYIFIFLTLLVFGIGWLIVRTAFVEKTHIRFMGFIDKVKIVSVLYLILDGFGIVILFIRNVR